MTPPVSLSPEIDAALQQMLQLSEEQRLYLSDRLAESVESMDEELAATVSRRLMELEEGRVEVVPAEQVYREAREHLRAIR